MARGTQHLKNSRRSAAKARPPRDTDAIRAQQRRERQAAEQGMFFPKLRTHAKWMFVLLVVVFAGGFVLFGVGSGSNGIGNVLQDYLHIGQATGGPSISKLESKTAKEPTNATAWRDLATAYEAKQRTDDAVRALERLSALHPKDANVLQELAGQYQRQLSNVSTEAQAAQTATPVVNASAFQPPSTTPLGRAFSDPTALQDPLSAALTSTITTKMSSLQTRYSAIQSALYTTEKKIVKLDPNDPTTQFQLAQTAESQGDQKAAVAAYKRFLKLSPEDPLAGQVKQRLKQLSAPAK